MTEKILRALIIIVMSSPLIKLIHLAETDSFLASVYRAFSPSCLTQMTGVIMSECTSCKLIN